MISSSSFGAKCRKDVYHFATFREGRDNPKMLKQHNRSAK